MKLGIKNNREKEGKMCFSEKRGRKKRTNEGKEKKGKYQRKRKEV